MTDFILFITKKRKYVSLATNLIFGNQTLTICIIFASNK
jgi:hypothetical protein